MKKKLILLTIIALTISGCGTKEDKNEIKDKNIIVSTETLNISEMGTEVNVEIKNQGDKNFNIEEIEATLYDSSDKEITKISKKINKQSEYKKTLTIKLTAKKQYPNTAKIKYKLYN